MSWRANTKQIFTLFALTLCLSVWSFSSAAATALSTEQTVSLFPHAQLFVAGTEAPPSSAADLPDWLGKLKPAKEISLFGGAYWIYAAVHNPTNNDHWVIDPDGRLIERVSTYVYSQNGTVQQTDSGYLAKHDYTLHYGKDMILPAHQTGFILMRIESPYYAAFPRLAVQTPEAYQQHVLLENVLALAAFGALLTLALYNLFIYTIHHDKAHFYYALYLLTYFAGWALTFQLPADLFGWHNLHFHYVPFFLLPVFNTLFYMHFLDLPQNFPKLAKLSRINIILPLALLPSSFIMLPYAHMLATAVISLWLFIAIACGIAALRSGFRPARYFVLAFMALLIPGLIILPANVGLMPSLVPNPELFTLLGGTLDAILLAFALADKIRRLASEKDHALQRFYSMMQIARTDHLTGILNRHAFDLDLAAKTLSRNTNIECELMLFLIDLDGLKTINDKYGHARGDELLCLFTRELEQLGNPAVSFYRLGGDEFTILASKDEETRLRTGLKQIEQNLWQAGFSETGVSFGVAYANSCASLNDLYTEADKLMYEHKLSRRPNRVQLDASAQA